MPKSKMINFRVTEEEREYIENNANKTSVSLTDYCKRLVLNHEVVNITSHQTINKLIDLWQEMEAKKVSPDILEKLKNIILESR